MPVALAAMEGHFESGPRAGLVLIGQPNEPLAPVHARLSSSPPEKSQHGDGESVLHDRDAWRRARTSGAGRAGRVEPRPVWPAGRV